MDLIALRNVAVGHHGRPLLPPVELTVRAGTFLGVVGPNGAGKTTLVRTMLGLLAPVSGEVVYPAGRRPRFGYVPQRGEIDLRYPLLAREVVMTGRTALIGPLRRAGARDRARVIETLAQVDVAELADRPFHELSGGQRQRVLLARALAAEPEILILDEPTAGMDVAAERAVLDLVAEARLRLQLATVMVTHQLNAVAGWAAELCLVDRDRGRIEVGTTEAILTSARLSRLYDRPVEVGRIGGVPVVVVTAPPAAKEAQ